MRLETVRHCCEEKAPELKGPFIICFLLAMIDVGASACWREVFLYLLQVQWCVSSARLNVKSQALACYGKREQGRLLVKNYENMVTCREFPILGKFFQVQLQ